MVMQTTSELTNLHMLFDHDSPDSEAEALKDLKAMPIYLRRRMRGQTLRLGVRLERAGCAESKENTDRYELDKVIAFRTDTFYGLGADPFDTVAVARIRRLKGREDKPILLLISDLDQLERLVVGCVTGIFAPCCEVLAGSVDDHR
jgi:hypothetical protein